MSTASLTAKYRPQTFAEVAGQQAVKTILSRAAAQDKVAPAYLFSGTRGVGKTTIARIFAKALNCANGPAAEPCNECVHCKQITAGIGVDVIEIDAASHGKVEDARRLKEDIGYAPIECRYKVFIIDEAHMLTTQAFNALLKTLEEPPPHATFIMATTETHKFPATIISRCQHYSFKMLSMPELTDHLENILHKENIDYEKGAVSLIAKRGAGSVRDSMSLLGQVLALGNDRLVEADIRSILGLAGKDVFFTLMQAIHDRDLVLVGEVVRQVLDQGLDLGFFIRELGSFWRNLFLIGQSGERAVPLLELSSAEAQEFMRWAEIFDRSFVHACWQMTVDGQRKVLTSLEPALALELLLLNMANLPDLISMEKCGSMISRGAERQNQARPGSAAPRNSNAETPGHRRNLSRPQAGSPNGKAAHSGNMNAVNPGMMSGQGRGFSGAQRENGSGSSSSAGESSDSSSTEPNTGGLTADINNPEGDSSVVLNDSNTLQNSNSVAAVNNAADNKEFSPMSDNTGHEFSAEKASETSKVVKGPAVSSGISGEKSFDGFLKYAAENGANGFLIGLKKCKGKLVDNKLILTCTNPFHHDQITDSESLSAIKRFSKEYFGPDIVIEFKIRKGTARKSSSDLRKEVEEHPDIARVIDTFGASIVSVERRKK